MRERYAVTGKEQALRGAILAAGVFALPIPPFAVFGIHAALVTFIVLAAVPAGFAVAFYALWMLGALFEGCGAELIGDSSLEIPVPYWTFGRRQKRIRRRRRIRALERDLGITDPWPL